MIIAFDNDNFKTMITENRYYGIVLFSASFVPEYEQAVESLNKITPKNEKLFVRGVVDCLKYPDLVKETKLRTLPHFVLYYEGKIMSEFTELYSKWDMKVHLGDDLFKLLIKVD